MIDRYARSEMAGIWDERRKYQIWLEIELAACEELAEKGSIPEKAWKNLHKKGKELLKSGGVDPREVEKHEKKLRHDVIAFTTAIADVVGEEARYIHFGLTSSDVLDTGLAIQCKEASKLLVKGVRSLIKELKKKAEEFQDTATIGRSHGIFAEPTSFGLKFLGWQAEWERNLKRLEEAAENLEYGKLSGAVGVNAHFSPKSEKRILESLGLRREPVSTQVIPRDRHAEYLCTLAILGSSIERIAVELRHLQRSEVAEVAEGFSKGQKGSSAMPHKKNPISSENLTGCARMLRSYAQAGLENIALWHERDISHSSVERVFFPDATILLDYALDRLSGVIGNLAIDKKKIKANLTNAGELVFSGHILLALVEKGAAREDAYYWVQECAHSNGSGIQSQGFIDRLKKHPKIKDYLSEKEISKLGSIENQLKNVPKIYQSLSK